MTKQTYRELKSLEAEIKQCEEFEGNIYSCLLRCDKKDYISFIKKFDAKLQREVLAALYTDYQKRTEELRNKFNELLEGEKNG